MIAISSGVSLVVHIFVCWLFVYVLELGVIGTIATANVSWWLNVFILFTYTTCGGCPLTWTGFSMESFTRLWEFTKLSASSGIMVWYYSLNATSRSYLFLLVYRSEHNFLTTDLYQYSLENWYYRMLIVMTGNLEDARIDVDSMSIWYVKYMVFEINNIFYIKIFFYNSYIFVHFSVESFMNIIFIGSMSINGLEMMVPLAFFAGTR